MHFPPLQGVGKKRSTFTLYIAAKVHYLCIMKAQYLIILFFLTGILGCSTGSEKETQSEASEETAGEEVMEKPARALGLNGTDAAEAARISGQLTDVLLAEDIEYLTPEQRRFRYAVCDLNDDGSREYLIELRNSYYCGSGGCTYLLLNEDLEEIASFTVSYSPFIISDEKSSGWRDLIIPQGSSYHVMKFDGKTYPGNPSVEPEIRIEEGSDLVRLLDEESGDVPEFTF